MVRDIEYYFFGHLDFFLWGGSVQFIWPFLHCIIDFGGVYVFRSSCTYLLLIPCQMYSWQRFFSYSVGFLFNVVQKPLNFM
jgi:hypothetical protein